MSVREEIESAWRLLSPRGPGSFEIREVQSVHPRPPDSVLLGLDGDGTRHVLVRVEPDATVPYDARSQGVTLQGRRLLDRGTQQHYLDVSCSVPRLFRVFSMFLADMLEQLRDSNRPAEQVCPEVLQRWRELLRSAAQEPDKHLVRGIYGELHQLAELAAVGPTPISCWTGPQGEPKDFTSPATDFEIKSLGSETSENIEIHGFRQLEAAPDGRSLYLVVQSVVDASDGGSLSELVDVLERRGLARQDVLDRLALVGISSLDAHGLGQLRFRVSNERCYRVDEEFPALTPAKLRSPPSPALANVRYQINLQGLDDWLLDEADFHTAREEFVTSCR